MKVIFSPKFFSVYALDPAAGAGRLEGMIDLVENDSFYEIIKAKPAKQEDILRAHTQRHFLRVKNEQLVFEMAMLAAGGSIQAAEIAYKESTASFGLVRPPGHHASRDSCWGFCYFNNIAVSLLYLRNKFKIKTAFLLDYDLHTGDGNINILSEEENLNVNILNPYGRDEQSYLKEIQDTLDSISHLDVIVVSAGFDYAIGDWGNLLSFKSYNAIGKMLKEYSNKLCSGRRYALLEGGYNYGQLSECFDSFCKGFGD